MKKEDNKLIYTYEDIHSLVRDNYKFIPNNIDLIIAIGTGGFIPARILKTYINVPIYAITVNSYISDKQKNNIDIVQWLDIDLSNKNVLIVDEIDDTRTTLEFCVNKLTTDNGLNNYGVFVIHNKLKTKKYKFPDNIFYYSCSNIIDKWVVYPWDIN